MLFIVIAIFIKIKKHIYPRKDVEEEVVFRGREAVDDFFA